MYYITVMLLSEKLQLTVMLPLLCVLLRRLCSKIDCQCWKSGIILSLLLDVKQG